MTGKISADDLTPEVRKKLGLERKFVTQKLVVLGKVLSCLEGLTTRDALWVIHQAGDQVRGYRTRTTKPRTSKQ